MIDLRTVLKIFVVAEVIIDVVYLQNPCIRGSYQGTLDVTGKTKSLDSGTNNAILLSGQDDEYKFTCCGHITAWEFYGKNYRGVVYFQVWRNVGASPATLVGENIYTHSGADGAYNLTVNPTNRIDVADGDYMGLYFPGNTFIPYHNGHQVQISNIYSHSSPTFDWTSVAPSNNRDYAVKAYLEPLQLDRINDIQISPLPSTTGHYSEGQNITLSCTGTLGAYPLNITWCIKRQGNCKPSDLSLDTYLREITQSKVQYVDLNGKPTCQLTRTSTVVYQVAKTDTGTTFYCQITAPRDSQICGEGTVRQQKSIKVAPTAPTAPTALTTPTLGSQGDWGLLMVIIINIVVTLLTMVVVIVAVFIAVIIYRRNNQRKKNTGSTSHVQVKSAFDPLNNTIALSDINTDTRSIHTADAAEQTAERNVSIYERLDTTQGNAELSAYQAITNQRTSVVETEEDYITPGIGW